MSQTVALIIITVSSWIVITIGAIVQVAIEHPGENKGVSILPNFLMIFFVIGLGSIINYYFSWMGTWIMLGLHMIYIIYGLAFLLIAKSKKQKNKV